MKKKYIFVLFIVLSAISLFLHFYDNTYTVKFDTDGGETIKSLKVKPGTPVKLPQKAFKKGYVFVEWQLNDRKYQEGSIVTKDITLKAKYLPEVYRTVEFNTDGGSYVSSIKVLSGSKIKTKNIKDPVKEGYNFDGWYTDNKLFDFNQRIVDNITLTAHYSKAGNFISYSDLKVGDNVLIIGSYAASSLDQYGYHTKAIGWVRQILYIYEGREFPYQVGNEYGTTGFFKVNSLKIVD